MKTLRLVCYLFMVTLFSASFTSCSSDGDDDVVNDKQLISVIGQDKEHHFTYDSQGRLTKYIDDNSETYTFTYTNNQITCSNDGWGVTYTLKNGIVISSNDTGDNTNEFTYNSDNQLIKIVQDGYTANITWQSGNITKIVETSASGEEYIYNFTYSDVSNRFTGISPFEYDSDEIMSLLFQLGYFGKVNKNLCLTRKTPWDNSSFNYEFAKDGIVSRITETLDGETEIYNLTYQDK